MNRFSWTALGMALMMLAACNASAPNEASEGGAAAEGEEHGEHEEAPLETKIAAKAAQVAGIQVAPAGPGEIADEHEVQGLLTPIDGRIAQVTARFPGPVRSVRAGVGDQVRAGQALATVESNLGLTTYTVTAPISGVANKQQVTEGALVGQGDVTLLTTVDQLDPLYVNFSLSVDELTQLRAQQAKGSLALSGDGKATVDVKLADGSTYGEPGTLDFSSTTVDPATGAVSLRALLPNPQQILLPGAFVSFQANLGERNNAYLVPQQALLRDTTGGYVMVVGADGKVVRKNVKTDGAQNGNWLVSDGLAAGDKVIVAGVQKVKEGAPAVAKPWTPGQDANGKPAAGGAAPAGAAPAAGKAPADAAKPEQADAAKPATTDSNKQ